jgi:hypothetical protein
MAELKPSHLAQSKTGRRIRFDDRFDGFEPVVDADFETIEAISISSAKSVEIAAPADDKMQADSATEKNNSDRFGTDKVGMSVFGRKPAKLVGDDSIAFYGFGVALVMLSFWVSGGHSLFRPIDSTVTGSIPAAASVTDGYSEVVDAAWRVVTIDGRSALHVEGTVRNSGTQAVHTRPVTVTVKQTDGFTKRYLLGQKGWTLGPGQEVVVSGRLDIASAGIASVVIALTN